MFVLSEDILGTTLDKINLITLSYYASKSDFLNIFDTNFEFNENYIPLITSVLETKPYLVHGKKYINVNSETFITIHERQSNEGVHYMFPSFYYDIEEQNANTIQSYSKKLINVITVDDNLLVRLYNLENMKTKFSQKILNEEELIIFVWNWEYANFQIIINKQNPKQCQLQLNVYVIEDNKFISSKLENINNIIRKLDKIKSIIK
jgi:hypothetical protein